MKTVKQEDGFTLVELMVVVGIVGILSAVAIPNFKRYQAKSKTSEAKLQLASIYSAETAMMSDFDYYVTCLNVAGYDVGAETPNRYYATGFNAANAADDAAAVANGASAVCTAGIAFVVGPVGAGTAAFGYGAGKTVAGNVADTVAELAAGIGALGVPAGGATFIAAANGFISADSALSDAWTIDENKNLTHAQFGY